MADYIERQAAIDAFNRIKSTLKNPETAHYDTLMFYEIEDVLEDVEPADVVPVVRCKDCENWQTDWNPSIPDRHYCAVMDSMMKAEDFCGYGERREG